MNNIILHRRAYFKIAKQLGVMKLRFYLHDLDKLILSAFMGDKLATKLHRKISIHHEQNQIIKDVLGSIIDWECARYTKPEKPLSARETLNKYYSHLKNYNQFITTLDELKL